MCDPTARGGVIVSEKENLGGNIPVGAEDTIRHNALLVVSPQFQDQLYGDEAIRAIQQRTRLLAPPMDPTPVLDDAFLKKAPRLRAIFYAGGSVRYFVSEALWARDITVCSAFTVNGEAVADYTVGAVLFSLKQGFAHATAAR